MGIRNFSFPGYKNLFDSWDVTNYSIRVHDVCMEELSARNFKTVIVTHPRTLISSGP